jgi:hypothetical protein
LIKEGEEELKDNFVFEQKNGVVDLSVDSN